MDSGEQKKSLVMDSWALMRPNLDFLSLRFFTAILDNIPEARHMFSFLNDSKTPPQNNHKLKSHALVVFKLTCNAAVRLQEKGDIAIPEDALRKLGSIHLEKGVKDSHFQVVKEALLRTVREAVGEQWSEELGMAWGVAFDKLAEAIKMRMKE